MVKVLKGFKSGKVTEPEKHVHYKKLHQGDCVFTGKTSYFESAPRKGSLSIRLTDNSLVDGEYLCTVNGRAMRLKNSECFLINSGETYSVNIESATPIDSFAIYYSESTVDEVVFAATSDNLSVLIDGPNEHSRPVFFDGYYPRNGAFSEKLSIIKSAVEQSETPGRLWLEEILRDTLFELIDIHKRFASEADRIAAARRATRMELFRRIRRACNFLDSEFENEISIADVAQQSCLSPYHLQRCFKEITGQSIQGYVRKKRMERAARLLFDHPKLSIENIATAVGFSHHSSFSRAFSRHFGQSPVHSRTCG